MTDCEATIHYATLVRLQLAMSALQNLLGATAEESAEDEGQALRIAYAREDAVTAIHITLGAKLPIPERLTSRWTDLNMVRNAQRAIEEG
jgi:hypothetical protein